MGKWINGLMESNCPTGIQKATNSFIQIVALVVVATFLAGCGYRKSAPRTA